MKNPSRTVEDEDQDQSEHPMDSELHELFLEELADIYDAEKQLTKALPKLAKAAETEELRAAFEAHLQETENHVHRLDEVFEGLGEKPRRKTCKAMQGLVEEGAELIKEKKGSSALDAGLIAAAQKVEHYEIASYGTLCAWAEQMGHTDQMALLEETLEEEKAADETLTEIAHDTANSKGH